MRIRTGRNRMSTKLKSLNVDQARFIALLAKAARAERDAMLGHGPEKDLNGTAASRGEHNPTAALGFDPLSTQDTQLKALRDALDALADTARSELYVLMRVGQGHLAAKEWHHGIEEAQSLGDATMMGALVEDPDLHDHISKGLYEAGLGS
jgi:Protein of unknown function (DUF3775)